MIGVKDKCRVSRKRRVTPEMAFAEFLENREILILLAPYWMGDNFDVVIAKYRHRDTRSFRVTITGRVPIKDDKGRPTGSTSTRQAKGEGNTIENAARNAVLHAGEKGLFAEVLP